MFATLSLPACQELTATRRAPTVRVRSANELQTALRHARQHAVTLDGRGLDRVLRMDAPRGLLEVQAATSWTELTRYPGTQKIMLDAYSGMVGLPATAGEAISQASAGPDGLQVTAHVASVTLVTPDGELRRADRDGNGELLRLALGGQGVIGVLYSVTLSIDSLRRSAGNAIRPVELGIEEQAPTAAAASAIECLLPPEELDGYLRDIRAYFHERRLALLGISVRRQLSAAPRAGRHARPARGLPSGAEGLSRREAPRRSRGTAAERLVPLRDGQAARRNLRIPLGKKLGR